MVDIVEFKQDGIKSLLILSLVAACMMRHDHFMKKFPFPFFGVDFNSARAYIYRLYILEFAELVSILR